VLVAAIAAVAASPAGAAWSGNHSGHANSAAANLTVVDAPVADVSGRTASVSWNAAGAGAPASGYTVKRYGDTGEVEPAGSCSGTVNALACTESIVPPGTWTYSVRPVRGNWTGPESQISDAVTVAAPSLVLANDVVTSFPTSLGGGLNGFAAGQSVTFRLDDPDTGPMLGGTMTPATIPAGGGASVSVTIPAGTSNGAHTVFAVGSGGDRAQREITVTAPKVTDSVIAKSAGGRAGSIRAGGTYHAYANVSGQGNPPAGLATLRADLSALTNGQASAALSHGSYTVAGQPYNYRTAQLTARASLTAGTQAYSVRLTDSGGTQTTSPFSVTVDNTKPTGTDVQTTNAGTAGRAEAGDTISFTYSEPMEQVSILAGWSGSATNVVVRLNNAANDTVQIYNATNSTQLRLGTVSLAAADYTTANRTFGAAGTPSTMTMSGSTVTVTLGTASGTTTTAANSSAMLWTPSASATDAAGNTAATSATTESGGADKNF